MKIGKLILLLFSLFYLAACAVLNTSNLDSARTLEKDRYGWMLAYSNAIDMNRMVYTPYEDNEIFNGVHAQDDPMMHLRFSKGMSEATELQLSAAFPFSFMAKVAIKRRLSAEDQKVMLAVKPAVSFSRGSKPMWINFPDDDVEDIEDWTYTNLSGEISLLITLDHELLINIPKAIEDSPRISITLVPKLIYSNLLYIRATDEDPVDSGTYRSFIPALAITPELRWRNLVLRPEIAGSLVRVKEGKTTLLGSFNCSAGVEFGQ